MNETRYEKEWMKKLDPKRFRPSKSTKVPKHWNPFNSDYSRISMSAPFRRLQDKAQVFPLEPNDFVRTRLTHSIEVSGVARSIGVLAEKWLLENGHLSQDKIGHIPSILASVGLAHDIGNPPFGHFGEKCIQVFFKKNEELLKDLNEMEKADLLNFDGNVQGLRLLLRLGLASDEFSYNLTFPTLATIVKYPKDSITGNQRSSKNISLKKYGFYQTDKDKYEEINYTLQLSHERHPLCYLLEAADDICYSVSDIEDGFKKNTITLDFLLDNLSEKYIHDSECSVLYNKIIKMKKDYKNFENKNSLIAQECRIFAQTKMIYSAIECFKNEHESIINGRFNNELLKCSSSKLLRNFLAI
ncbi:dGTP triphosphohydrolase [Desulfosarcina cetonica]|uniref:dGTP triphosphohydrolase n=1 Tax=Desulfosarcina cetonica TaxID=90730 RepID=UPI0009F81963|nr:dNTP triphosphohydrolase [Desulfosarcina cetonica]